MIAQAFERLSLVSGAAPVRLGQPAPSSPGAYLLLLHLKRELCPPIRCLEDCCFAPGLLVYAGNAYGPGGIAARLKRHFRANKPVHWHIDHLTAEAATLAGFPCPDGGECDLIEALLASGGFVVAAKGFGSSDCRDCESHLLRAVRARS